MLVYSVLGGLDLGIVTDTDYMKRTQDVNE